MIPSKQWRVTESNTPQKLQFSSRSLCQALLSLSRRGSIFMLQLAIQHWTIECLLAWTHGIQPNTTVSWLSVNFLTVITANAASALSGFHKVITTWDTCFDGAWYDCEFDTVLGNPF
jgi:hypothetical protein